MRTRQRRPYSSLAASFIGVAFRLAWCRRKRLPHLRTGRRTVPASSAQPRDWDDVLDAEGQLGGLAHASLSPGRIEGEFQFDVADAGDATDGALGLGGQRA